MRVELITTGTELLIDRVNTHVVFFGKALQGLGLEMHRQTSVGDGAAIEPVLREALKRSDCILVTGGLGPTSDDLTRDVTARVLNCPLEHKAVIEEQIREFFAKRKYRMPDSVLRQAYVPRGAEVLPNPFGTACGLYMTVDGTLIFLLPGPPRELHPMWENEVLPRLRQHLPASQVPGFHTFTVAGLGESRVQEIIEGALLDRVPGIELAYCASPRLVELRLRHPDPQALHPAIDLVRQTFKRHIQTENAEPLEAAVIRLAEERGVRVATAESCTGGMVAHRLTDIPGASNVFDRGWTTYSNQSKIEDLGVRTETIETHGAVSGPVAREMVQGALERSGADLAVSLTGIAGPGGGTPGKPVGLVYFGFGFRSGNRILTRVLKKNLVPPRQTFKKLASQFALDLLRRRLLNTKPKNKSGKSKF